jgi:hypothetical protein
VLLVAGVALAVTLSGCSVTGSVTGSTNVSDSAAVTLGAQAAGAKSTASPSGSASSAPSNGTTDWSSTATCPDSFGQGVLGSAPAGSTLTPLDASSTTGVKADPNLFQGDIPNCAYVLADAGSTADIAVFIGMPASYQAPIVAKLESDGFVVSAPTAQGDGTVQFFTGGVSRIAVEKFDNDGVSIIAIVG